MSSPTDSIEFVSYDQPALLDGAYTLLSQQQAQIDGKGYCWGPDQWSAAPAVSLQFSVAGPRFTFDPSLIQSQFPPPKSIGEYYNVLPHIILNRTTLPWERTIDNSAPSITQSPKPWLVLLLFDKKADEGAPAVSSLTVRDLIHIYGNSATPTGQPEFVKILPREYRGTVGPGEFKLEVGEHVNDRLTVIDVPKKLLYQILPSVAEIALLSHVRKGNSAVDPSHPAEYPVIFCNRLPAPGTSHPSKIGTESTVHLVSLESRQPLLDALKRQPNDNHLVRFVSLASWSFSTLQNNKTFTDWIKEAWSGVVHSLRMPVSTNAAAERFLSQGYAPIRHQTRQGNHLISWYRSPFLPGKCPAAGHTLPVHMSDELVRYLSDVGMFDTSYAAAWELGRTLTLRSKRVSISLFNWKRTHAQQVRSAQAGASHLPFAPDHSIAPDLPQQVSQWFAELRCLRHVPFHYLVPRVEMLPANSLRFFQVDLNWVECLLDGAFSIGRVSSSDVHRDRTTRLAGHLAAPPACSGFLLRSPVVTGWPHLGVEAYTQIIPDSEAKNYRQQTVSPTKRLRFDRLGEDILLCLFEGDIRTVDIHEHPETIHFGVDTDQPEEISSYYKELRKLDGTLSGTHTALPWKNGSSSRRTLDIAALADVEKATNSAEFGVTMIEGVEMVRFIKADAPLS
jgi:hypothetical protein